jgi:sec-independent protein translocase protein TatB
MFDIGWSEVLVIAVVAVIVVGPKELPRMLRAFGKTMGQVRRTANDFKRQFDEALREAEREAGLDDAKKQLQALNKDPFKDAKKDFDDTMRRAATPNSPTGKPAPAAPSAATAPETPSAAVPPAPTGEPGAAIPPPSAGEPSAVTPARESDAA